MKHRTSLHFMLLFLVVALAIPAAAQTSPENINEKREKRKNMTIREFNTDSKGKNRWMDHMTVYNDKGLKTEETEYAPYGMQQRITFDYDNYDRCIKEVVYDDRNKVVRIRKYEYNPDGTKKTQYNYLPNGRLFTTKQYQYSSKGE